MSRLLQVSEAYRVSLSISFSSRHFLLHHSEWFSDYTMANNSNEWTTCGSMQLITFTCQLSAWVCPQLHVMDISLWRQIVRPCCRQCVVAKRTWLCIRSRPIWYYPFGFNSSQYVSEILLVGFVVVTLSYSSTMRWCAASPEPNCISIILSSPSCVIFSNRLDFKCLRSFIENPDGIIFLGQS